MQVRHAFLRCCALSALRARMALAAPHRAFWSHLTRSCVRMRAACLAVSADSTPLTPLPGVEMGTILSSEAITVDYTPPAQPEGAAVYSTQFSTNQQTQVRAAVQASSAAL